MRLPDVPNNTDKGYLHGYLDYYEELLGDLNPAKVLEVGVDHGHSLRLWADYWPAAAIHGIDIGPTFTGDDRCTVHVGDAYTTAMVESLPGPFDFILDDGPHDAESQSWFVTHYLGLLAPGGVLAVEDVWTPDIFDQLTAATPKKLRSCIDLIDLRDTAPDQSWSNHLIFVVDTRKAP